MGKTIYTWDETTGTATCRIPYNHSEYIGVAKCHPEDEDFKSELIGSELAYSRACIKVLQAIKNEKRAQLQVLKELYGSLDPSPRFNPNSFEAKMMRKKMDEVKADIEMAKDCICLVREDIDKDITKAENFYQKVRKNRKQRDDALKREQEND
jgi:hypothetical protein